MHARQHELLLTVCHMTLLFLSYQLPRLKAEKLCFHTKGGTFTPSTCFFPSLLLTHSALSLDCTRAIC